MELRVSLTGFQSTLTEDARFTEVDALVIAVVGSVIIDDRNLLTLGASFQIFLPGNSDRETVVRTLSAGWIEGVNAKRSMRQLGAFSCHNVQSLTVIPSFRPPDNNTRRLPVGTKKKIAYIAEAG
jgi:hypothetical protein